MVRLLTNAGAAAPSPARRRPDRWPHSSRRGGHRGSAGGSGPSPGAGPEGTRAGIRWPSAGPALRRQALRGARRGWRDCGCGGPPSPRRAGPRAWAMLWVTMSIVYEPRNEWIKASIRSTPSASRAEHGSSMRITLGFSGRSRAMHSFCCCSRVSRVALRRRLSLTSSQSCTSRRADSATASSSRRLNAPRGVCARSPNSTFS